MSSKEKGERAHKITIKRLPKSEIEMDVSMESRFLDEAYKKAVERFALALEVDGFRKGHVPHNMVLERIGADQVLREAADILLNGEFHPLALAEGLVPLGHPNISITKLALGNSFEWKALFPILPTFDLPNYKAIAGEENNKDEYMDFKPAVEEKEIDMILENIRRRWAYSTWYEKNKGHHDFKTLTPPDFTQESNLPPLDDDLAKTANLGLDGSQSLDDLKAEVRRSLENEELLKNLEKRRASILDRLLAAANFEVPTILIDSETDKSISQMQSEIERAGHTFEAYLKEIGKSEDELRQEFAQGSNKKAKIQLILNSIAKAEKLEPNQEILNHQVSEIMKHYKDARDEDVRVYVATELLNRDVLKLLESQ